MRCPSSTSRRSAAEARTSGSYPREATLMEEIAEVYARAVFEVAQERDKLDTVREQLSQFADAVSENRDLQVFLFSPYFSTDEKKAGLDRAVSGADPVFEN